MPLARCASPHPRRCTRCPCRSLARSHTPAEHVRGLCRRRRHMHLPCVHPCIVDCRRPTSGARRARHATRSTERPGGAPGRARRAGRAHGMPECMQAAAGNRTKPYRCAHTLCAESGGGTTPLLLTHIEKTRWGVRRRTSRSTQLGQSSAADTFTHLARGSGQVRIRVRDSCTTGARRTERRACTRRVESYHRGESGQPP